jgi:hypothetical protein
LSDGSLNNLLPIIYEARNLTTIKGP